MFATPTFCAPAAVFYATVFAVISPAPKCYGGFLWSGSEFLVVELGMPCGGIYPIAYHFSLTFYDPGNPNHRCCVCHGQVDATVDLFVDNSVEGYLHRACLGQFLCSPEGECVIEQGHAVLVFAAGNKKGRR